MHWHVDYLLAVADRVEVFVSPGLERSECELHAGLPDDGTPVIGFGSSDCRCVSHLAYFRQRPVIELMRCSEFVGTVHGEAQDDGFSRAR